MLQRELVSNKDVIEIDKIWQSFYSGEFGLPPLDSQTLYHTVIEDREKVVGFGQIRATAESIMVIDQSLTMREKIQIVRLILEKQLEGMIVKDITECHAFAQNPRFARMLVKHFGYQPTIGESVVLKI
jgi:hypothetical protein